MQLRQQEGECQLNFEEAQKNANLCFDEEVIPQAVHLIMADEKTSRSSPDNFWEYAATLKTFVEEEGRLPVSGVVPDMISTTENYVNLTQIY